MRPNNIAEVPLIPILKWVGLVGAVLLLVASVRYVTRHSLPIGYDETVYVNQVIFDRDTLLNQGMLVFARKQMGTERWRPPGYRLAAAPVSILVSPTPISLRLISLASFLATGLLLFGAGREFGGSGAGVVWATGFGFAAGPLMADLQFGTEVPLYPAIAGSALGIARWFSRRNADRTTILILFLSAAVGGLSKLSFFVVFLPFVGMGILLAPVVRPWWRARRGVVLGVAAGLLLISPWWAVNWRDALHYASYASQFVRHNFPWLHTAAVDLLGIPFTIGFVATMAFGAYQAPRWLRERAGPEPAMALTCLAGMLPLVVLHLGGSNHNMRLLTPAWVPGAGLVTVVLLMTGVLSRRRGQHLIAVVLAVQAAILALAIATRQEGQRDWGDLRDAARRFGMEQPRIEHLGESAVLNAPQILYAWRRTGETVRVKRLWRWERGPPDWTALMDRVDSADVVVIPMDPRRSSSPDQDDNVHNDALIQRLLARNDAWVTDTLSKARTDSRRYLAFIRRPKVASHRATGPY